LALTDAAALYQRIRAQLKTETSLRALEKVSELAKIVSVRVDCLFLMAAADAMTDRSRKMAALFSAHANIP
jgi:hypothetical protein